MFKVTSDTAVPGFRVGVPDEVPGFSIDENGSVRRPLPAAPGAAAFGDSYGNVPPTVAPTALMPVRMFDRANNAIIPTQYHPDVPVSGGSPSPDPLRRAIDQATNPYANSRGLPVPDPLRQAVDWAANPYAYVGPRAGTPTPPPWPIIGSLVGGLMGGALGLGIGSPFTGAIGSAIGSAIGTYAPGVLSEVVTGPAGESLGAAAAAGVLPGGM
jgi:hypothetical protein